MHIAFHFSHGFAARMILRAGVARRLIDRGARVTVISPNSEETYFQRECEQAGVNLEKEASGIGRVAGWFRAYRPYLLDDVMRNPALRALHFDRFENHPVSGRLLSAVNKTVARSSVFRTLCRAVEHRLNRSKSVRELLRQLKPDLLVVFTPFGLTDALYLLHAKELGIRVVCQMLSWDNITSKGTPLVMPDYFISWGPIMTDEMVQFYGFPRDRIFECGAPHFDVYHQHGKLVARTELLEKLGLRKDRPYIFYGMVARYLCPSEMEIVAWLADKVNRDRFAQPCSLVVRPHPQTISGIYSRDGKDLETLKSLTGPKIALDVPPVLSEELAWDLPQSDMYHLASLLAGCAMCINASSTLCLDACMLDRPVINIGFDGFQNLPYEKSTRRSLDFIHMRKLIALGGVSVARSFDELETKINDYLCRPDLHRAGRKLTVSQECGLGDGRAAERVAATLIQLARPVRDGRRRSAEVGAAPSASG